MTRVLGLDLSLTSTGVAACLAEPHSPFAVTTTIRPKKLAGLDRIRWIKTVLADQHLSYVDLAVMEGPSYRSTTQYAHELAGLWWMVRERLWAHEIPVAIVPPNNRAQYGSGNGQFNKRELFAAMPAHFPMFDYTKRPGVADEADALILAAMGADWLGYPLVDVPDQHRKALTGCQWPVLTPPGREGRDPLRPGANPLVDIQIGA